MCQQSNRYVQELRNSRNKLFFVLLESKKIFVINNKTLKVSFFIYNRQLYFNKVRIQTTA